MPKDVNNAIGKRLRITREALGYPVRRKFAKLTDVPEGNLEKWENAGIEVPTWYVAKLKALFGITFDWVYDGDISALPHSLAIKLFAAMGLLKYPGL